MGETPNEDSSGDSSVNVDLSDSNEPNEEPDVEGFQHPDDDEIETSSMDDIPEVNSAEDAVDGDKERMERLQNKAKKMKEENNAKENQSQDQGVPETSDGTPVSLGDEVPEKAQMGQQLQDAHNDPDSDFDAGEMADNMQESTEAAAQALGGGGSQDTPDSDNIDQAGSSLFSDEEADEIEEEYGDFELETLDDIPDDFDYESQDTGHYGAEDEAHIRHNGVVFKLEQPEGAKEDKFWSEIQTKNTMAGMFDTLIKYGVSRPRDIGQRMEDENWTGFAKAGLATKVSAFLGLDGLQDF